MGKAGFIRFYVVGVLAVASFLVPLSKALAQGPSCRDLFKSPLLAWKPDRLYDHYQNEIWRLSDTQVRHLNEKFLDELTALVPPASTSRAQSLNPRDLQALNNAARSHDVVSQLKDDRYQRDGIEIGYCFGRAMYIHLTALKMGLQKDSVLKIWAVGPMASTFNPENKWGYHVATVIYTKEGGWLVVDPNSVMPQTVETWMKRTLATSTDQRLRFYVTEAEKFGLYGGAYSRYQLGLSLAPEDDFFKGYFVDLLKAVRTETLEKLNLRYVTAEEGRVPEKVSAPAFVLKFRDFLGI